MRETKTFGNITKGKLTIYRRDQFLSSVSMMQGKSEKTRVEVIVKKIYNKRSSNQLGYYWGYLIAEFCRGYLELNGEPIAAQDAHDFLKAEFNYKELINTDSGEVKKIPQSTADKTTVEFIEYCNQCAKFITEWFGIEIHEPREQTKMLFNEK